MSIPLERGRFFTNNDNEHAPGVVVIDTEFARKYFPNQDPVGQQLNLPNDKRQVEIIGVVGHVKQWSLDADQKISPLQAEFYFPWAQTSDQYTKSYGSGSFSMVQTDGHDPQIVSALRNAVHQISNEMVIANPETMTNIVADSIAARRFTMILLSIFAALALVLASIGIYGVISYTVGERTQEIGVRMALGAERFDILRLVLANGGRLLLIGVGVGLVTALALTRTMQSQIAGIRAADPVTFLAVTFLLSAVAVLACYLPARRAAKVDPMVALRYE
jgi:predicted permease